MAQPRSNCEHFMLMIHKGLQTISFTQATLAVFLLLLPRVLKRFQPQDWPSQTGLTQIMKVFIFVKLWLQETFSRGGGSYKQETKVAGQ